MKLVHAVMALATLLAALGGAWVTGLRVNLSASIPLGLYHERSTDPRGFSRGRIVMVCLPSSVARFARDRGYLPRGTCHNGAMAAGKVITAVSGDTVRVGADGITVNGSLLSGSVPLLRERSGRALPQLARGTYLVPAGAVWLGSRSRFGFDSRYFGAVPVSAIRGTIDPVWTP